MNNDVLISYLKGSFWFKPLNEANLRCVISYIIHHNVVECTAFLSKFNQAQLMLIGKYLNIKRMVHKKKTEKISSIISIAKDLN